jgi:hypothetical protein
MTIFRKKQAERVEMFTIKIMVPIMVAGILAVSTDNLLWNIVKDENDSQRWEGV